MQGRAGKKQEGRAADAEASDEIRAINRSLAQARGKGARAPPPSPTIHPLAARVMGSEIT